ncbi:hypothetical protein C8Q75DRAFT_731338 [Abortiporus biennis]|nr:hypothetical protein C8Q75DRAFT_731338 [Abortiporus biennis]
MTTWPTSTLLDFVYGSVALKMFGRDEARDVLRKHWGSKFYSSDVGRNRDGGQPVDDSKQANIAFDKCQHDNSRFGSVEAELCVGLFSGIGVPGDPENKFQQEFENLHKEQNEEKIVDWLASVQSS